MNNIWLINLETESDLVEKMKCPHIEGNIEATTTKRFIKFKLNDMCGLNKKICNEKNCPIKDSYKHRNKELKK